MSEVISIFFYEILTILLFPTTLLSHLFRLLQEGFTLRFHVFNSERVSTYNMSNNNNNLNDSLNSSDDFSGIDEAIIASMASSHGYAYCDPLIYHSNHTNFLYFVVLC